MDFFRRILGQPKAEELPNTSLKGEEQTVPAVTTQPQPERSSSGVTEEFASSPLSGEEDETLRLTPSPEAPASPPVAPVPAFDMADGATRQLAPEKFLTNHNDHLTFGQSTDVGMVRSNNQDAVFSFFSTARSSEDRPDFGLFLVADGMGGHQLGEKASAISARVVASYVMREIFLPMLNGSNDSDRTPINEALIAAVQKANADVLLNVQDGGTTLTAVAIVGDLAHIVHVGDSRVYLISKDSIERITRDHSLVERLIELGQIPRQDAADHSQKNVLYRAVGQSENLEVDTLTRRLPPGARLLLCSDGLWGQVEEEDIRVIVMGNPPQEACDKLVKLANSRGGMDNITVIILKLPQ